MDADNRDQGARGTDTPDIGTDGDGTRCSELSLEEVLELYEILRPYKNMLKGEALVVVGELLKASPQALAQVCEMFESPFGYVEAVVGWRTHRVSELVELGLHTELL